MLGKSARILLVGLIALLFVAPAMSMPGGPPWMSGSNLTVEVGCTCHGDGVPSPNVIVSISGVPRAYDAGETYTFTISLQDAENQEGGFLIWDYGAGTFTPGEGSRFADDEPRAIGQSDYGNNWVITWTAPAEDTGDVNFQLVGNAVNGNGNFDSGDHWNILSFIISSPGTATNDEADAQDLRTISVGDFETLFVAEEDPEAIEAERQAEIAEDFFEYGNIYYWFTLSIILVGAVVQGQFYEKKFSGGPPHLDMRIAVPQGIRRGLLSIVLAVVFAWTIDSGMSWGYNLVTGMLTLWALFGVYRTIVQARAPEKSIDLI